MNEAFIAACTLVSLVSAAVTLVCVYKTTQILNEIEDML